ncbi:MAG TPA: Crp/Fnr family transcriptional regulator [Flavisolibacter sp.]|jgi:CRP-like cAMP-binding protein|nr:Crp/Fnr family transcriptional regulator [Flavisolibacter sp.]
MHELLREKINAIVPLTKEEFANCLKAFTPRKLRKKQYLLQAGDEARYQAFVEKGLLRTYTVDEKGGEHILQFASEGWWMADLLSFLTHEPSAFHMEALEDSEVLLIDKASWDRLLEDVPRLERYFRVLIQNNLIATQRRVLQSLSESAEEKYVKFMKAYPDCLARVPQQMVASYLGLSRETVSRLHRQLANRFGV